jgi:hypothetical protein
MKRGMIYLLIALPCAAVLMGVVILVLAFSEPDRGVRHDGVPLSKTSWQQAP